MGADVNAGGKHGSSLDHRANSGVNVHAIQEGQDDGVLPDAVIQFHQEGMEIESLDAQNAEIELRHVLHRIGGQEGMAPQGAPLLSLEQESVFSDGSEMGSAGQEGNLEALPLSLAVAELATKIAAHATDSADSHVFQHPGRVHRKLIAFLQWPKKSEGRAHFGIGLSWEPCQSAASTTGGRCRCGRSAARSWSRPGRHRRRIGCRQEPGTRRREGH